MLSRLFASSASTVQCMLALVWMFTLLTAGVAQQNADEQPPNPMRITGIVRGPSGPAEGVRVLLELRDMRDRRPQHFAEVRTDTEGAFEFDISNFNFPSYGIELITVSPRFIESNRIAQATRAQLPLHIELELRPGTIVRGKVVDSTGKPISGVTVSGSMVRQQQSDEEGNWEVFGIPPGGTQLRFEKQGYAFNFFTVNTEGPEIIEGAEIKMESARELKGRIVNWEGEPIPYADIVFKDKERYLRETSDKDGHFIFRGIPDEPEGMYLTAMKEGYLPTEHEITAEEAKTLEVEFVIDHGVYLSGKVTLPSGKPAAGASVVAGKYLARSVPQAETDSNGNWKLGPFPPAYEETITALPPNMDPSWGVADMSIKESGKPDEFIGVVEMWPKGFSSDFNIKRNGNTVTLTRRDEGPGGLAAEVIYTGELDPASNIIKGTVNIPDLAQQGTFQLQAHQFRPGSLVGEWELKEEITASTLNVAPIQQLVTTPILTGIVVLDLPLTEASTLSGTAVREDGSPFADGYVELLGWNDTNVYSPRAEIGIGGRFTFNRVPPGIFRLRAVSENREVYTNPIFARGGNEGLQLKAGPPVEDPMDE